MTYYNVPDGTDFGVARLTSHLFVFSRSERATSYLEKTFGPAVAAKWKAGTRLPHRSLALLYRVWAAQGFQVWVVLGEGYQNAASSGAGNPH